MATPIGHAIAGWAVHSWSVDPSGRERRHLWLVAVLAGIAPDLDFVPGVLVGRPAIYHHAITHSLGAALVFSVAVAAMVGWKQRDFFLLFRLALLSYSTHLLIDFLGPDGRLPYGIPVFWPLSSEYVISSYTLFLGMRHVDSTNDSVGAWLSGVFQIYNVAAIGLELVLIGPFVWIGRRYRRIRSRRSEG